MSGQYNEMLNIVVAFDKNAHTSIRMLTQAIMDAVPNAYIFFVEHSGVNPFNTGALLNAGVHLAGLSTHHYVNFFSFTDGKWSMSKNTIVEHFLQANGYENNASSASELDCSRRTVDGYFDIFPVQSKDKTLNNKWFHYSVQIERDKVLNVEFIPPELNIHL